MFAIEKLNYLDFDIYSRRISFYYNNKEKVGSLFGFILTALYALISLILFLIYFAKTMQRKEVSAANSTIYPTESPTIDINNDLLYLAFALEHPTKLNRYIDEKIYRPEVVFIERIKKNGQFVNKSETILEIEQCDTKKFGKKYQDLFHKDELNDSYCIKNINLTLRGGFKYDELSYIRIDIYPCVNSTKNNNHCKSKDEIDKHLTSAYFSLLVKDVGFNPFNYSIPTIPILQDLYTTIDKSIFKEYLIYIGIAEIDTDIGLFSNHIKKDNYIKFIRDFHSFFFVDQEYYNAGKKILTAHIRLEDSIFYLKRKYTKMSEVFSSIGGYMQIITTIFTLIALFVKKFNIEEKLLNSLFNFNIKKKKILLCIEYEKKLDYTFSLKKENPNHFIPYKARKSIIDTKFSRKNNVKKQFNVPPIVNKKGLFANNNNNNNNVSQDNLIEMVKKISQEQNSAILKKTKKKMFLKEDHFSLNDKQVNRIININKRQMSNSIMKFNSDRKKYDEGKRSMISFNLFDYYCFRKITKKKVDIDLFNFGITFYKSQMDIINFFNIMVLTQILLTQQQNNSKNNNFLNQTIELSIA
jgi:hypothetical protein